MADRNALVERLFAVHRGTLLAFFARRVRQRSEATDLAQEVYVRMLRVKDLTAVRDMEGYLYTVASNLAKEHAALARRRGIQMGVDDAAVQEHIVQQPSGYGEVLSEQQAGRLRLVLRGLPPLCHAAIVMQYVHGLNQQQIAERLQISPRMVKQHVAQALALCRRRMARWG